MDNIPYWSFHRYLPLCHNRSWTSQGFSNSMAGLSLQAPSCRVMGKMKLSWTFKNIKLQQTPQKQSVIKTAGHWGTITGNSHRGKGERGIIHTERGPHDDDTPAGKLANPTQCGGPPMRKHWSLKLNHGQTLIPIRTFTVTKGICNSLLHFFCYRH